jgi:hypothetical protein
VDAFYSQQNQRETRKTQNNPSRVLFAILRELQTGYATGCRVYEAQTASNLCLQIGWLVCGHILFV